MRRVPLLRALVLLAGPLLALALPRDGVGPSHAGEPPAGGPMAAAAPENRLARERSPYLRQHRTNPVDWYPWGEEAFARARREGRPVLLSVGYAACHWCHVMEHESFEDPETARRLNAVFVCVKVDREERPDVDRVYMNAVQLLAGRGGWPMTVLLLPDGRPFHAATYLPRAALQQLTARVEELWATRREALEQQASLVAERLAQALEGPDLPAAVGSDRELLARLEAALDGALDREHGGYGQRPKFPPHAEVLLALERADVPGGARGLAAARLTLERMEEGGLHDQVGGGFHRYSTDAVWLVPHFEKMLYDNALLAQAYAGLFARTREPRFARTLRRLLGWLEREMRREGGGYASSLDADTQGHEGLTYTWTPEEVRAALGAEDAAPVLEALGIRDGGNYDEEATGRPTGRSIPHLPRPLAEAARARGLAPEAWWARLDPLLERLRTARDRRPQPGLDDKEIAAWNGLLLSAFARSAEALADPTLLERGRALARRLREDHRSAAGLLLRFPRGSGPEIPGFCEDLVHVAEGLLDLAEAGGGDEHAREAQRLADDLLARFEDREGGGFWASAPGTHETLIARAKEIWDSPIPSDNGTAARLLLRLAARTGERRYREAADRTLAAFRPLLGHPGMARGVVGLARALALRLRLEADAPPDALPAGDASTQEGVVRADAWLERAEAAPGGRVAYALRVRLEPGWHVNAAQAPSDRVATSVTLSPGSPVEHAPPVYPEAGATAPGAPPGYAGTFWIRGALVVPPGAVHGPRRVVLRLTLQPCDATSCQAARTLDLPLSLRLGPVDGPRQHSALFPG